MSLDETTMRELEALVAALAEGELSAEQRVRLAELLREHPEARRFYQRYLEVHVMLDWEAGSAVGGRNRRDTLQELLAMELAADTLIVSQGQADTTAIEAAADETNGLGGALRFVATRPAVWGALAAVLVLGLSIVLIVVTQSGQAPDAPTAQTPPKSDADQPIVASLTGQHDARWASPFREEGDVLRAGQTLTLNSGFAEITTRRGAVAILEGPCSVELIDHDNAIRLHRGKLVGIVETDSAKGFTVRTPAASVVDHGTRFGVAHEGVTQAWVLEGQVSVSPRHGSADTEPTVLRAGMGAVVDEQSQTVAPSSTLAEHFYSQWDVIAQMPRLRGEIRYEPAMPKSLYYGEFEREWVTLFRERSGVRLSKDLEVTVDGPGDHYALNTLESTLPAGTRVDSYLLHLDLPGEAKAQSHRSATITFDRPILAVVSRSAQIAACDAVLGQPGVRYIKGNAAENKPGGVRGMEPATSRNEAIKISDDRRTLTVDMILVGTSIDQARVLLEAEGNTD